MPSVSFVLSTALLSESCSLAGRSRRCYGAHIGCVTIYSPGIGCFLVWVWYWTFLLAFLFLAFGLHKVLRLRNLHCSCCRYGRMAFSILHVRVGVRGTVCYMIPHSRRLEPYFSNFSLISLCLLLQLPHSNHLFHSNHLLLRRPTCISQV